MSAEEKDSTEQVIQVSAREVLQKAVAGSLQGLLDALKDLHEADIADAMLDLPERDSWIIFDSLDLDRQAEVLACAEDPVLAWLLGQLTPRQIAKIVESMAPDDVVDLLAVVGSDVAERVLRDVKLERAAELRKLAEHAHDTAGGRMTTDFLVVREGSRIGDAIKLLKSESGETEAGQGLYVVDEDRKPIGYVPDRELLRHSIHATVDSVMADPMSVPVEMDQEEVAHQIVHYALNEIAVVDKSGAIVGVVSSDDAQDVLEDEANEDMLRLVGTSSVQQTRLPVLRRVRERLPLQALTVLGGLITAWIIKHALGDVSTETHLLRFIPIIIGLAGNVGIQASTILVRAFATGEVEREREMSVLGSETYVGLLIGLVCGSATALFLSATSSEGDSTQFPIAIGVAISSAVTWAAFLGCVVPMTCRRAGIDPAIVAGPFLITVSDISGTALYLGVASLLV